MYRRSRSSVRLAVLVTVLALGALGCDSDNKSESSSSASDSTPESTGSTSSTTGPTDGSAASGADGSTAPGSSESPESTDGTATPRELFPTSAPANGNQNTVLAALPGSGSSSCVTVKDEQTLRSGDIAVGDFVQARSSYSDSPAGAEQTTVSLYVVPQHTKPMSGVTVRLAPIHATGKAVSAKSTSAQQADVWKYYAVSLPVPSPGTWKLTASTKTDRGCFRVTFKR